MPAHGQEAQVALKPLRGHAWYLEHAGSRRGGLLRWAGVLLWIAVALLLAAGLL